ncbi:hypothetical protein [Endozoicomonas ascidiicola]|uniref:hypothetical protein n=1 Tax=Endozoicomonas ascidiicola TaxID=1698521 RepID=UPI000835AB6C|nr:hypothetical protein [Endozoicomonas ascidiicola]
MKFHSARQAIHDAYAIHMRSKGFEVNLAAAVSQLDALKELSAMHRKLGRMSEETPTQKRQKAVFQRKIEQYAPVSFAHGDRSTKMDVDQLIWDSKDAAKVIAVVEKFPAHLKAWCYWCYSPLGDTNQGWFKQIDAEAEIRKCLNKANELSGLASGLPGRIARCKTEVRRAELSAMDTNELMEQAADLEEKAIRLTRVHKQMLQHHSYCAPFWNWLDKRITENAPRKIRQKTLINVHNVCRASVYNYRHQVVTGIQKPLMSRKVVCEMFGVPSTNFEGSYRPWVSWSSIVCDELDKTALPAVAKKLELF